MSKVVLCCLFVLFLPLTGCFTMLGLSNSVKVVSHSRFDKGQSILIKQRDVDRLEFGNKIAKFFEEAGYNVFLSEQDMEAQYALYYEYDYIYDVFHNTLESLDIIVRAMQTREIIVNAHFQAFSPRSADSLLNKYLKEILTKMESGQ